MSNKCKLIAKVCFFDLCVFIICVLIASMFTNAATYFLSDLVAKIGADEFEPMIRLFICFAFSLVMTALFEHLCNLAENKAKSRIRTEIRNAVSTKTVHVELSQFFSKGKDYYLNSQISSVDIFDNQFLDNFFSGVYFLLFICLGCINLSLIYTKLAVMMVAAIVVSCFVTRFYDKVLEKMSDRFLTAQNEHVVFILDVLDGFLDIYFNQLRNRFCILSKEQAARYERANEKYTIQKEILTTLIYLPMFIMDLLLFSVCVYGIINGETGIEALVAYINIGGRILNCAESFFSCVVSLRGGISVLPWELIEADQNENESAVEGKKPYGGTDILDLKNVQYSRDGKELINIASLRMEKGQKYLLTGRNGCGKSTLLKIFTKGIVPDAGTILFKGENLSTVREEEIYSNVAVVPQNGYLFSGSLIENIFFEKDVDPQKCSQVIEASMLTEFVSKHGLNYQIASHGANVSGGEKQRILLARAIARKKDIIFLDEPFVGLDKKAVSYFEEYFLNNDLLTVFMISHDAPGEAVRGKLKVLEGVDS